MGWRRCGIALLLLCLAARASPAAQEEPEVAPGPLPHWEASLESGLAVARERGGALLVALNMDHERGNQRMVDFVYRQDAFREATAECVVAIASLGKHRETKDAETGKLACSRFGSVTCAQHQALEKIIREDWLHRGPKDDIESPRHFFLAPDGRILFQRTWTAEADELVALMKRAGEFCTPGMLANWDTKEGRFARLADPLAVVRQEALRALLALADAAIDQQLVGVARKTKDAGVRQDIVEGLVATKDEKRRALAYPFLADRDAHVRTRTAYALERQRDTAARDALLARLGKEKDAKVRAALLRALGACADGAPKVRDALLKIARKKKNAAAAHAIVALAPWAQDEAVLDALVKVPFGKASNSTRQAACWLLGLSARKDLAAKLTALAAEDRNVEYVANMAAQMLSGSYDEKRYRDAASWVVRHPVYDAKDDD